MSSTDNIEQIKAAAWKLWFNSRRSDVNAHWIRLREAPCAAWRRIRLSALRRDAYRCVQCGWIPDVVATYDHIGIDVLPEEALILDELRRRKLANKRHLHVDHIETVESKPELRLALGNLQVLCSRCHSHKTAKEDGGFGRR